MTYNPRSMFYVFDAPVPYKDLLIYPVKMRDYLLFNYFASCLSLEKNSVPDVKIISMTYFEYLYSINNNENNLLMLFDALLRLVLNKKDDADFKIGYWKNDRNKPFFKVNDVVYDSSDFDALREIIAEQNYYELPDETIQKEVRDKMDEVRKFRQKINKNKVAGLEEQLIALSLYSGWDMKQIYDLTIRKFILSIKRANHMIHSEIYLNASMSGFAKFKDKSVLRGWLADLDDDNKKDDTMLSLDSVQNKINSADAIAK